MAVIECENGSVIYYSKYMKMTLFETVKIFIKTGKIKRRKETPLHLFLIGNMKEEIDKEEIKECCGIPIVVDDA